MERTVQERLVIVSYETLTPRMCHALSSELEAFLTGSKSSRWRLRNCRIMPLVQIPRQKDEYDAPDWSRMKLISDKFFQYERSGENVVVQFYKNFFTVNAFRAGTEADQCPGFDVLMQMFGECLPFIKGVLLPKVILRGLQYEVIHHLGMSHLRPLLSSRYNANGMFDYLDVFSLLRNLSSEANADDWELDIPLKQELAYHIKGDPDKKRLQINTDVGLSTPGEWYANIDMIATSRRIDELKTSDERIAEFETILPQYNDLHKEGVRRLLTTEMYAAINEDAVCEM